MSQVSQVSQPNLSAFVEAARTAPAETSLRLSGNEVERQSRAGAYFSLGDTHRATIDGFVQALGREYGGAAASLAGNLLANTRAHGQPLRAYMVQHLTVVARQEAVRNFIDNPGEFRGLDQAAAQFCAERGFTSSEHAVIRQYAADFLRSGRGEFNSAGELYELVHQGRLPGLDDLVNLLRYGEGAALGQLPGSREDKVRLFSLAAPPGGLAEHQSDLSGHSVLMSALVQALPRMREMQPEGQGPLTAETAWRAAFGGSPPWGPSDGPLVQARAFAAKGSEIRETAIAQARARAADVPSVERGVEVALSMVPPEVLAAGREGQALRVERPALPVRSLDSRQNGRVRGVTAESLGARMLGELYGFSRRHYSAAPVGIEVLGLDGEARRINISSDLAWSGASYREWSSVVIDGDETLGGPEQRAAMRETASNLGAALSSLGSGDDLPEPQLKTLLNCMGQNGNFVLRNLEHALGLERSGGQFAYSLALSPGSEGAVELRLSVTAPGGQIDIERSQITISVRPDGSVTGRDLFVNADTPPSADARAASMADMAGRAARSGRAAELAAPLLAPEGLAEYLSDRARQVRGLEVTIKPELMRGLADRIEKKIQQEAERAETHLTEGRLQELRDSELESFLTRIEAGASRVPENQRDGFARACLESGLAPRPEIAAAAAQLARGVGPLLGDILAAPSAAAVRERLGHMAGAADRAVSGVLEAGNSGNQSAAEEGLVADDLIPVRGLALLMALDERMGAAGPDEVLSPLTRQDGPYRDALYDLNRARGLPGVGNVDYNGLLLADVLRDVADMRASAETAARLDPESIREEDLSPARRLEIGPEVLASRAEARIQSWSDRALRLAAPLLAPERLAAVLTERARKLSPGVAVKSSAMAELANRISGEIREEARAAAAPLGEERLRELRDKAIGGLLTQIERGAANVPENRRPAFVQACLESGQAPSPELAAAAVKLAGDAAPYLRALFDNDAYNVASARDALEHLGALAMVAYNAAGLDGPEILSGGGIAPAAVIALTMALGEIDPAGSDDALHPLIAQGRPFRDALYDLHQDFLRRPAQETTGVNERQTHLFNIHLMAEALGSAARARASAATAARLDMASIREGDLSRDRQISIFGREAVEARGPRASVQAAPLLAPERMMEEYARQARALGLDLALDSDGARSLSRTIDGLIQREAKKYDVPLTLEQLQTLRDDHIKQNLGIILRANRAAQIRDMTQAASNPERLAADVAERARTLFGSGLIIEPRDIMTKDLKDTIRRTIDVEAGKSATPLASDEVQALRDREIEKFLNRLKTAADQVPEDLRSAFVRICLESGGAPKPEIALASARLARDAAPLLENIFAAASEAEVLANLDRLVSAYYPMHMDMKTHNADLGEDDFEVMRHVTMYMTLNGRGADLINLTRPDGPFRGVESGLRQSNDAVEGEAAERRNFSNSFIAHIITAEQSMSAAAQARVNQAASQAAPLLAPEGLAAVLTERAQSLGFGVAVKPPAMAELADRIGGEIREEARAAAAPLGEARLRELRDKAIGDLLTQIEKGAANVPEDQRDGFARACLESGQAPRPELAAAAVKLAGDAAPYLRALRVAYNADSARDALEHLGALAMVAYNAAGLDGAEILSGGGIAPAAVVALTMALGELDPAGPDAALRPLIMQGQSFRDALYDLHQDFLRRPAQKTAGVNERQTHLFNIHLMAEALGSAARARASAATAARLDMASIREGDLSMARQISIFGQAAVEARGPRASVQAAPLLAPERIMEEYARQARALGLDLALDSNKARSISLSVDRLIRMTAQSYGDPLTMERLQALRDDHIKQTLGTTIRADRIAQAQPMTQAASNPERLAADVAELARDRFGLSRTIAPREIRTDTLGEAIRAAINAKAEKSVDPLASDEVQALRDQEIEKFLNRLNAAADQVPEDQRPALVRICLERGQAPSPEIASASARLARGAAPLLENIFAAASADEVRDNLRLMTTAAGEAWADAHSVEEADYMLMRDIALRMALTERGGLAADLGRLTRRGGFLDAAEAGLRRASDSGRPNDPAQVINTASAVFIGLLRELAASSSAAAKARRDQATELAAPLLALDQLAAAITERAQSLSSGVTVRPLAVDELAAAMRREISEKADQTDAPLTRERVQELCDKGIKDFFDRIEAAAAQVSAADQRPAFVRACLEMGTALKPELAQAAAQMARTVAPLLENIFAASSSARAREDLGYINEIGRAVADGAFRGARASGVEIGREDTDPMQSLALCMALDERLGQTNPDAALRPLTRPGSPFRDALYDLSRGPGSPPVDEDDLFSPEERILHMVDRLRGVAERRVSAETAARLDPESIREEDLSLARQREIFGPGVFSARGANLLEAARRNELVRGVLELPSTFDAGRIRARLPEIEAIARNGLQRDLVEGPTPHGTRIPGPQEPGRPLSTIFSKDYNRNGVYVDGRYYHPAPPPLGTGTSEADFIALFPSDGGRAARLLSNLLGQHVAGYMQTALANDSEIGVTMSAAVFANGMNLAASSADQTVRLETLDAAAGRYRVYGEYQRAGNTEASGLGGFMSEISLEVTLGEAPRVDNVHIDFLLRGREPAPGDPPRPAVSAASPAQASPAAPAQAAPVSPAQAAQAAPAQSAPASPAQAAQASPAQASPAARSASAISTTRGQSVVAGITTTQLAPGANLPGAPVTFPPDIGRQMSQRANTCFIVSVLRGLAESGLGREHLSRLVSRDEATGDYYVRLGDSRENHHQARITPQALADYSTDSSRPPAVTALELAVANHLQTHNTNHYTYGTMGDAADAAFLLGLRSLDLELSPPVRRSPSGDVLTGEPSYLENFRALVMSSASGQPSALTRDDVENLLIYHQAMPEVVTVYHAGVTRNAGHYTTVLEVDGEDVVVGDSLASSADNHQSRIGLNALTSALVTPSLNPEVQGPPNDLSWFLIPPAPAQAAPAGQTA